jgi:hypothetical protein
MPTFCLVFFVIGALLAAVLSARQFVLVAPLFALAAFSEAVFVGTPIGRALLAGIGLFICGQFGYVAGIGFGAFARAILRHSEIPASPKAQRKPNTINPAPPS